MNIDKLNDHELVDLKNSIERELKRRADGPKVTTYYVVSCITDARHFTDLDCALRCLKSVTEDLMEWVPIPRPRKPCRNPHTYPPDMGLMRRLQSPLP